MTADAAQRLFEISRINLSLGGRTVLDHIDLGLNAGEILTLIGPNGAGKTTLVRVILGLQKPDSGDVWRRPGVRVGYVPQRLTVADTLPLTVQRFLTLGARAGRAQLLAVLEETGVAYTLDSPVQSLSGGEMQRVLLARALLREPDWLVLDEPVQGVDAAGQVELYRLIGYLRHRYHCGVLMVSHDLHLVMAATDRVICLDRHVCCAGAPEAVSRHPEYRRLFSVEERQQLAFYAHHHDHSLQDQEHG